MQVIFARGLNSSRDDEYYLGSIITSVKSLGVRVKYIKRFFALRCLISWLDFRGNKILNIINPNDFQLKFINFILKSKTFHVILTISSTYIESLDAKEKTLSQFKKAIKKVDFVICYELETYNLIMKRYRKLGEKFCLIENGYSPLHGETSKQLKIKHTISVLNAQKNPKMLLKIIESLIYLPPNYELVINPFDSSGIGSNVMPSVMNFGISDRVHVKKIEDADIDVAVDLSSGGFSGRTLEVLSLNIPVIGSRIDINLIGYCSIQSLAPRGLAQNIKNLCENHLEVDLQSLERLYSWNSRAKQHKAIYEYIVKNEVKYV